MYFERRLEDRGQVRTEEELTAKAEREFIAASCLEQELAEAAAEISLASEGGSRERDRACLLLIENFL